MTRDQPAPHESRFSRLNSRDVEDDKPSSAASVVESCGWGPPPMLFILAYQLADRAHTCNGLFGAMVKYAFTGIQAALDKEPTPFSFPLPRPNPEQQKAYYAALPLKTGSNSTRGWLL
jgi:hypothetical protein